MASPRPRHHGSRAPRAAARLAAPLLTGLLVAAFTSSSAGTSPRAEQVRRVGPVAPSPVALPAPRAAPGAVVVLGDSVAAGSRCGCTPFGTLLAQGLAERTGAAVGVTDVGTNGLTSGSLLAQLGTAPVRRALSRATVVTVTIGANDFDAGSATDSACAGGACYAPALAAMSAHVAAGLKEIARVAPTARVLVTGYWNVFLDGDTGRAQGAAYVATSDALTRRVNGALAAAATAAHATYVDDYGPFESRSLPALTALLAPDGDHPSAAGHALLARLLLEALSRPRSG